jgi:hypothetical protein
LALITASGVGPGEIGGIELSAAHVGFPQAAAPQDRVGHQSTPYKQKIIIDNRSGVDGIVGT